MQKMSSRDSAGFNISRRYPTGLQGLQAVITKSHIVTPRRIAFHLAALALSMLYSFWHHRHLSYTFAKVLLSRYFAPIKFFRRQLASFVFCSLLFTSAGGFSAADFSAGALSAGRRPPRPASGFAPLPLRPLIAGLTRFGGRRRRGAACDISSPYLPL